MVFSNYTDRNPGVKHLVTLPSLRFGTNAELSTSWKFLRVRTRCRCLQDQSNQTPPQTNTPQSSRKAHWIYTCSISIEWILYSLHHIKSFLGKLILKLFILNSWMVVRSGHDTLPFCLYLFLLSPSNGVTIDDLTVGRLLEHVSSDDSTNPTYTFRHFKFTLFQSDSLNLTQNSLLTRTTKYSSLIPFL